jgi:phosphopantetheinyl transferase (holo-ACP synthase)
MNNCFTVHEWQQIRAGVDDRDRMRLFATFWTLKEALIKALGYVSVTRVKAEPPLTLVSALDWDLICNAQNSR